MMKCSLCRRRDSAVNELCQISGIKCVNQREEIVPSMESMSSMVPLRFIGLLAVGLHDDGVILSLTLTLILTPVIGCCHRLV